MINKIKRYLGKLFKGTDQKSTDQRRRQHQVETQLRMARELPYDKLCLCRINSKYFRSEYLLIDTTYFAGERSIVPIIPGMLWTETREFLRDILRDNYFEGNRIVAEYKVVGDIF